MFGRIKIRRSDKLFREYLLKLRGEISAFSGKRGKVQVSHFHGRRHENTRFDEENCDLLTFSEHQYFEENPAAYQEWKLKQLGEKKYKELMVRANTYKKRDDKLQEIILKKLVEKTN